MSNEALPRVSPGKGELHIRVQLPRAAIEARTDARLVLPKILEPLRREFRVAHRVHDVFVPEVVL